MIDYDSSECDSKDFWLTTRTKDPVLKEISKYTTTNEETWASVNSISQDVQRLTLANHPTKRFFRKQPTNSTLHPENEDEELPQPTQLILHQRRGLTPDVPRIMTDKPTVKNSLDLQLRKKVDRFESTDDHYQRMEDYYHKKSDLHLQRKTERTRSNTPQYQSQPSYMPPRLHDNGTYVERSGVSEKQSLGHTGRPLANAVDDGYIRGTYARVDQVIKYPSYIKETKSSCNRVSR